MKGCICINMFLFQCFAPHCVDVFRYVLVDKCVYCVKLLVSMFLLVCSFLYVFVCYFVYVFSFFCRIVGRGGVVFTDQSKNYTSKENTLN